MKIIVPILLIAASAGLFFGFIDPSYERIKTLRAEEATFDQALSRARELQAVRDELLSRYNTFLPEDLERLNKLLPDHVDNVRLILDLDSLATQHGMRVRNVSIESSDDRSTRGTLGPDDSMYESLVISFGVEGPYDTFRAFLADLERSLRLVDITKLAFTAKDTGIYEYAISLRTYWQRP